MNDCSGTARVHEGHVDNGRVVIARIFTRRKYGCQSQKTTVRNLGITGETSIDDPIQKHGYVRVEFQDKHYGLLGQIIHLGFLGLQKGLGNLRTRAEDLGTRLKTTSSRFV